MRMPHAALPQLTFACVSEVSAKFKSFDWSYNKTTFPKAKDGGMADANVLGLSAEISFEMKTNADAVMTIDDMKATIALGKLEVTVEEAGGSAAKKWMYNKLLALFDEKIKEVVQKEVRRTVNGSIGVLTEKITAVAATLAGKSSGQEGAPGAAAEEGIPPDSAVAAQEVEPEPEPEPEPGPESEPEPESEPGLMQEPKVDSS